MSDMKLNNLICAAACVCREEESAGKAYTGKLLVLDLDACGAALLRCRAGGNIALIWEAGAPFDSVHAFEQAMVKTCGISAQFLSDNRRRAARAYRRYLQNERAEDMIAVEGASCVQLEQAFSGVRAAFQNLFGEVETKLQDGELDEIRILTIGSMADNFLAEYCVRERFSSDPLLPDPLFWELDESESRGELAERGRKLLEEREAEKPRSFGKDVSLCLINKDGHEEDIVLARAGQNESELTEPRFTPPFLYLRGEPLRWRINGEILRMPLPGSLLPTDTGADMISAALVLKDGSARILLRNERTRTETVETKLPQAADAGEGRM